MGAIELLREAHRHHFAKQFDAAVDIYRRIVDEFPDSKEAESARQQIENLRPTPKTRPLLPARVSDTIASLGSSNAASSFPCPSCGAQVSVAVPVATTTLRCGACNQELRAETSDCESPFVVITAKIEAGVRRQEMFARPTRAIGAVICAVLVAVVGWRVQRRYFPGCGQVAEHIFEITKEVEPDTPTTVGKVRQTCVDESWTAKERRDLMAADSQIQLTMSRPRRDPY
jgi:hypothetical protein